jgi:hypothetical protein
MKIVDALQALGSTSVVWVDDKFNRTPHDLADLLIRDRQTAAACGFLELDHIFVKANVDEEGARVDLEEVLGDLATARVDEIRKVFFEKEASGLGSSTKELSDKAVEKICEALQVKPEGRWTFDRAAEEIGKVKDGSDEGTTYIVDLNEAGGLRTRGLEILRQLQVQKSKGNAFILTHDATTATEAQREEQLRADLTSEGGDIITLPLCVIAKERLFQFENEEALNLGLVVGVKRAAVRRSLFDVIDRVRGTIKTSFENAAEQLLSVPPEQLEAFVFERGYTEGVSELHVVERILTSQIAHDVRLFFGKDEAVLKSAFRLRGLREIPLSAVGMKPDANLARFRMAEIWESDELINHSYSPIACGDVFEFDPEERSTAGIPRRFVLLGQPCDISLRPDGKRAQEIAFLIQLKKRENQGTQGTVKMYPLPFKLDGEQWACSFRDATVVRLSVLDLASFRVDGRVRVDSGHVQPSNLLVSQQVIYGHRTAAATKALHAAQPIQGGGLLTDGLQLCVSQDSPFKQIFCPAFEPVLAPQPANDPSDNKKRVTWRLRRCGRIRHPYVSALLDGYLDVMGRHAFDVDFMDVELPEPVTAEEPAKADGTLDDQGGGAGQQ